MPNYARTQSKDEIFFMNHQLPFGDIKTMELEEEMSLKERVQTVLDSMSGKEHGKKARLARIAGCSGPVINHWLNGTQDEMNFGHAQKIAKELGFRVEWLMTGIGPRKPGEGEELLKNGMHMVEAFTEPELKDSEEVDLENDLFLKVSAEELKLITRYRNATPKGKNFIEMASINAPKDVPGKH